MSVYFLGGPDSSKLRDTMYEKIFSKLENPPQREDLESYSISNLFLLAARAAKWPLPFTLGPTDSHYIYRVPDRKNIPEGITPPHITQRETLETLDYFLNGATRHEGSVEHNQYGSRRYGNTGYITVNRDIVDQMLNWMSERIEGKEIRIESLTEEKRYMGKLYASDHYKNHSDKLKSAFCKALGLDGEQFQDKTFLDVFSEICQKAKQELLQLNYRKAGDLTTFVARHYRGATLTSSKGFTDKITATKQKLLNKINNSFDVYNTFKPRVINTLVSENSVLNTTDNKRTPPQAAGY